MRKGKYPGPISKYEFIKLLLQRSCHSRGLLIGNPVFSKGPGCPITDFGHDDHDDFNFETGSSIAE